MKCSKNTVVERERERERGRLNSSMEINTEIEINQIIGEIKKC